MCRAPFSDDDWWVVPCNKYRTSRGSRVISPLHVGEGLAHLEVTRRFGVRFRCVAGSCSPTPLPVTSCHVHNNWGPIFVVQAVGVPQGEESTGFFEGETDPNLTGWMNTNLVCPSLRDE